MPVPYPSNPQTLQEERRSSSLRSALAEKKREVVEETKGWRRSKLISEIARLRLRESNPHPGLSPGRQ